MKEGIGTAEVNFVKRALGNVIPVGETNEDERRLDNLLDLYKLTDALVDMLITVSEEEGAYEGSRAHAGYIARQRLQWLRHKISDALGLE